MQVCILAPQPLRGLWSQHTSELEVLKMTRIITTSLIVVLLVFLFLGCDQARNPFNAISDGIGEQVSTAIARLSLPAYPEGTLLPGTTAEVQMAPAASNTIEVESNLFADGNEYPNIKKIAFNSINDFNSSRIKVWTALPGYITAKFVGGGVIYDLWVNDTKLTTINAGGSFELMFDTNGNVLQLSGSTGTGLLNVKFSLTTNESTGTTIYLSSDATGWASVPMTYKGSQTWEWSGSYVPDKEFAFVLWSEKRARYTSDVKVNGTTAIYLVKIEDGTNSKYPVYHFKGKLNSNGTFINSGADNRTAIVN